MSGSEVNAKGDKEGLAILLMTADALTKAERRAAQRGAQGLTRIRSDRRVGWVTDLSNLTGCGSLLVVARDLRFLQTGEVA